SAQVTTGSATLKLEGDVTVTSSAESSGASAANSAQISGKLDLGILFSGAGGQAVRTFNIGDSATPNIAPDLTISAVISDSTGVALRKQGPGTLLLTNLNTYTGPTRIEAGIVDIGLTAASSTAAGPFGASTGSNSTVDFAGGSIQVTNNTGGSAGAVA